MSHVMLVEDEVKLANSIGENLRTEGYLFEHCSHFEEVLPKLRNQKSPPDVLILDRLLYGKDSIDLLESIRSEFPEIGLIVLSAIGSPAEKARAIDRGADDYLAKPFAFTELVARIRALERRSKRGGAATHLTIGNLILDWQSRTLMVEGNKVVLTNKEFLVLRLLAQQPGRIFSKVNVLESVWEVSAESESNVVEATLNAVRKKLREFGASVQIKNMRNVGYWLES